MVQHLLPEVTEPLQQQEDMELPRLRVVTEPHHHQVATVLRLPDPAAMAPLRHQVATVLRLPGPVAMAPLRHQVATVLRLPGPAAMAPLRHQVVMAPLQDGKRRFDYRDHQAL
ncbi:MAG: hypothetical protein AMJ60_08610 [Desulfobacterales bacterium SG8_35]|nr:MAG: hypothetical protein AMJ60_08610 [Desulfobacterales bacterium SG8_35]